tara:strand:- start:1088 stop:1492 length:405 start_codon:yes stop_codon:yes gene_type:complete
MKFLSQKESNFSIEITPLIDIVFLLVIFFVVTSKVGDSQFLSLDLPKTESFEYKAVQSLNEIVIMNDGSVYINNEELNIKDMNVIDNSIFNLPNNEDSIILSAHSESLHIWVISIMDILNKYGFDEVQIRTIEK